VGYKIQPKLTQNMKAAIQNYKYVKIERNIYSCLDQNPLIMGWLLYVKGKPIEFRQRGLIGTLKSLRRILAFVKKHVECKHLLNNVPVLELPFFGNLCMEIGRGYKVFDLRRGIVTKIFKTEIDEASVASEISSVRETGRYNFAPSVHNWDIKKRCYQEDYVNGYRLTSTDSTVILNTYYRFVASQIENMILSRRPQQTNLSAYINRTADIFSHRLAAVDLNAQKVSKIKNFIYSAREKLSANGNFMINLGLSHGDFGHNHVVCTKQGTKIIDWEYYGNRSILFDFFNCFFVQLFLKNTIHGIVQEINKALLFLSERLGTKMPELTNDLVPLAEIYRWVFYIERVCSTLELHGLRAGAMERWIEVFEQYERKLSALRAGRLLGEAHGDLY
jgi:thiamine kinase-like enzyme